MYNIHASKSEIVINGKFHTSRMSSSGQRGHRSRGYGEKDLQLVFTHGLLLFVCASRYNYQE